MENNIYLINLGIGLGTLAVAISVAAITYQQYRVNRLRLRHELFERRFAVFRTAQIYLSKIMQEGRLNDETFRTEYPKFMDAWQRSQFLFGKDIGDYLDSVRRRSLEMRDLGIEKKHNEAHKHLTWLCDQTPKLFDRFGPYLCFPVK